MGHRMIQDGLAHDWRTTGANAIILGGKLPKTTGANQTGAGLAQDWRKTAQFRRFLRHRLAQDWRNEGAPVPTPLKGLGDRTTPSTGVDRRTTDGAPA
jgi:hypothetical protein